MSPHKRFLLQKQRLERHLNEPALPFQIVLVQFE